MRVSTVDKFKGALLGCAVGGAKSIGDGCELITDDTRMTVALAQSIIEFGKFDRSLAELKLGPWIDASANRAGDVSCAALRAGPVGLRYYFDHDAIFSYAVEQAQITHTDTRAIAGSAAIAYMVAAGISDRGELNRARLVADTGRFIAGIDSEISEKVAGLTDYLDAPPEEGFSYTSALFAFLRTPYDFEETVITAVNASGDSDAIGAIAGLLSGCFNGLGKIPAKWKNAVEGSEYIESVAVRLFTLTPASRNKKRNTGA
ncbi:MAG: hypothetical protein CVT63_06495 [Candidatus Anoxymicrobium japonicum]|uniref:ADP-ribosylglycohydrolase n=1 Tax=Candidatus Anoxymicrobium japonicum TaxID=2013648 RepID=A0A2N3G4T8_9ACTN|nr:MAG: hypothetical protein CVT63_06495 [Candidatus Anoxymicrobium japonicum]